MFVKCKDFFQKKLIKLNNIIFSIQLFLWPEAAWIEKYNTFSEKLSLCVCVLD